jgi:hypothetical protein
MNTIHGWLLLIGNLQLNTPCLASTAWPYGDQYQSHKGKKTAEDGPEEASEWTALAELKEIIFSVGDGVILSTL